jgi:hypothetical protein
MKVGFRPKAKITGAGGPYFYGEQDEPQDWNIRKNLISSFNQLMAD